MRALRQQVSQADADVKEKSDNLTATLSQLSKVERQLEDTERQYSEQIMIITVNQPNILCQDGKDGFTYADSCRSLTFARVFRNCL